MRVPCSRARQSTLLIGFLHHHEKLTAFEIPFGNVSERMSTESSSIIDHCSSRGPNSETLVRVVPDHDWVDAEMITLERWIRRCTTAFFPVPAVVHVHSCHVLSQPTWPHNISRVATPAVGCISILGIVYGNPSGMPNERSYS